MHITAILNFVILQKRRHVKQCQPLRYCSLTVAEHISEVSLLVTKVCNQSISSSRGWLTRVTCLFPDRRETAVTDTVITNVC